MRIKTLLKLETAENIANEVFRLGIKESMCPLAVAVLDNGGHSVVIKRQDGAGIMRCDIAIGKAWGALGMGIPSRLIRDRLQDRPVFQSALAVVSVGRFVPVPGGVLINDDNDETIGAVGVSGDTSDKDEYCAIEAILLSNYAPNPALPSQTWRNSKL
jgi:uncharacterized protein GlcG (DUF336 family)